MSRLGQVLENLDSERFEAFLSWLESGEFTGQVESVRIKGPKKISSVAISEPLLNLVREEMRAQGVKSLSSLVESLLWEYASRPPELVETYKPKNKQLILPDTGYVKPEE